MLPMLPVHKERLRTLYSMVAGIPKKYFKMSSWRSKSGKQATVNDAHLFHGCDTAACALGWACAYPQFKKAGLMYDLGTPAFGGNRSFSAGEKFFGLTYDEAHQLFRPVTFFDGKSEKAIFLTRLLNLLELKGIIGVSRYNQLLKEVSKKY